VPAFGAQQQQQQQHVTEQAQQPVSAQQQQLLACGAQQQQQQPPAEMQQQHPADLQQEQLSQSQLGTGAQQQQQQPASTRQQWQDGVPPSPQLQPGGSQQPGATGAALDRLAQLVLQALRSGKPAASLLLNITAWNKQVKAALEGVRRSLNVLAALESPAAVYAREAAILQAVLELLTPAEQAGGLGAVLQAALRSVAAAPSEHRYLPPQAAVLLMTHEGEWGSLITDEAAADAFLAPFWEALQKAFSLLPQHIPLQQQKQ
jgi:hypothetical protein